MSDEQLEPNSGAIRFIQQLDRRTVVVIQPLIEALDFLLDRATFAAEADSERAQALRDSLRTLQQRTRSAADET